MADAIRMDSAGYRLQRGVLCTGDETPRRRPGRRNRFRSSLSTQAALAAEVTELKRMSVHDVASLRQRLTSCCSWACFYHLRHPLLALDLIHTHVAGDMLICQLLPRGNADRQHQHITIIERPVEV
jgi:hypothetical protein